MHMARKDRISIGYAQNMFIYAYCIYDIYIYFDIYKNQKVNKSLISELKKLKFKRNKDTKLNLKLFK